MLISVAVPVPQLDLLTYRIPVDGSTPAVGARVVVPLGSRVVTGIVVAVGVTSGGVDESEIKTVRQLLDAEAFVPAQVVELARWTAEYYAAGAGETITAVLPPMTRGGQVSGHKTQRVAAITVAGLEALSVPAQALDGRSLTVGQRRALEVLGGVPAGIAMPRLAAQGIAPDTIARLSTRALVSVRHDRVDREPLEAALDAAPSDPDRQLTLEQAGAFGRLRRLADERSFRVALLHGVTGSGKTEIFLRVAAAVRSSDRSVLMLVPEIALTPVIASLFRQAFAGQVAILHSGLSDGERHDEWQRIRRGEVHVVVGTRSAVFAPLSNIGLIVVDEEHDGSYKQEESPRYHARDVAIVRGQRERALVLLASATPSMESYHNAMAGRYERVVLERRVRDRPLASVTVVDMREEYAHGGPDVVLSRALGRWHRRAARRAASRRWCFSTAAGLRRPCSAVNVPARSSVPTAACRWWFMVKERSDGRAVITATTRCGCRRPARSAPAPISSRPALAPNAWKPRCGVPGLRRVWPGWIETRFAGKDR